MAKERLLVEIEKELRDFAKQYAAAHRISLSQLVEQQLAELRRRTPGPDESQTYT
jgi:predicted HicB family RNase H-like nuclease